MDSRVKNACEKLGRQNIFSPSQLWRSIHTYGSSEYAGPSMLRHTARCSSKRSTGLSRSRRRCSTRVRQTDQLLIALDTPSASIQTEPNMSRDSGQSSRRFSTNSIWLMNLFGFHINEQIDPEVRSRGSVLVSVTLRSSGTLFLQSSKQLQRSADKTRQHQQVLSEAICQPHLNHFALSD